MVRGWAFGVYDFVSGAFLSDDLIQIKRNISVRIDLITGLNGIIRLQNRIGHKPHNRAQGPGRKLPATGHWGLQATIATIS